MQYKHLPDFKFYLLKYVTEPGNQSEQKSKIKAN